MEKYTMESVIRGHHVYKSILHPILGEQLVLERVEGNGHDRHTVSVMKMILSATYRDSFLVYTGTLYDVVWQSPAK